MIKLGSLTLNGIPRVAVGVKDNVSNSFIHEARELGVDIMELRIDQYASFERVYVLNEIKKFGHFPTLATLRSRKEGGGWNQSEQARLDLFKAVIPHVDAIDIELSSSGILPQVIKAAHSKGKQVVVSYHNFDGTPAAGKLKQVFSEAKKRGADIVKIAALILKREDMQRLAVFTIANAEKNLISIGMGSYGANTRILFPGLGSLITYAYLGEPTAPGQLDYQTTFDLLRRLYPSYNQAKISSLKILENV